MASDHDANQLPMAELSLRDLLSDLQLGPSLDFSEIWNAETLSKSLLQQSFSVGQWLAPQVRIGDDSWRVLSTHRHDMVREWAAIIVGCSPDMEFARRLAWMKLFADDPSYGVREIAWRALRAEVIRNPVDAIKSLVPWTGSRNERLRRFASEITRPFGVRCQHVSMLKQEPKLGLPILEPLLIDDSTYVQNSVANWLRDALRCKPEWVEELAKDWHKPSSSIHTQSIFTSAFRMAKKSLMEP